MSTPQQAATALLGQYVWFANWSPVGYPVKSCSSTQDYPGTGTFEDPQTGNIISCMRLKAAAEGVVKNFTKDHRYIYIAVAPEWSLRDTTRGDIGWVPAGWLTIGLLRKHGDKHIIREGVEMVSLNKTLKFDVNVNGLDALTTVLTLTFQGILNGKDLLSFIPEANWKTLGDLGPRKLAEAISAGIKKAAPNYYKLLNGHADWSLKDVQDAGRLCTNADKSRSIIYSIAYFFEKKKNDAQYIGYTSEGPEREKAHDRDIVASKLWHYSYARGYKTKNHRVLCDLGDRKTGEKIGPWAEQALILLSKSQAYFCKYPDVKSVSLQNLTADEIATDDSNYADSEAVKAEAADKRIQARLLIEVFNKACAKVPGFRTNTYKERVTGLNHESPVASFGDRKAFPYTRIRNPNGSTIYRSHLFPGRKTAGQRFETTAIHGTSTEGVVDFDISCTGSPIPPVGVRTAVVVEIMDNGQRHSIPWARLPPIGPFRGYAEGNAIGIRVEWQENGRTMSMPVQSSTGYSIAVASNGEAVRGVQTNFVRIEGLRRYFQQERIANPQAWFRNYGVARILDVKYDHLRQEITMTEIFNQNPPITLTKDRVVIPKAESIQAYRDLGVPRNRIDSSWKVLNQRGSTRKSCDRCYALNLIRMVARSTSVPADCTHADGRPCAACAGMALFCTFTDTDDLKNDERLIEAVSYIRQDQRMAAKTYRFVEQIPNSRIMEGK
ncbi:hypothetical protein KCU78_g3619, partial [Aureobasidium melanogenum]